MYIMSQDNGFKPKNAPDIHKFIEAIWQIKRYKSEQHQHYNFVENVNHQSIYTVYRLAIAPYFSFHMQDSENEKNKKTASKNL